MKYLIVVRHGLYEYGTDKLTEDGRGQIFGIGEKMRHLVIGKPVILTSTAPRARESAAIFAELFGGDVEVHDLLYSDGYTDLDMAGVLEFVGTYEATVEVVIMVTHLEYVRGFPGYFCKQKLGASPRYPGIDKGEALVIDCAAKTILHVRP